MIALWRERQRHRTGAERRFPSMLHLSARFVEWMMGLPDGWVTNPAIWRGEPGNHRNLQLRLLGNGVVPPQAAHAIRWACETYGRLAPDAPAR